LASRLAISTPGSRYLSDDNVVCQFVQLPPQCRTERAAEKVAEWIHQGLVTDMFKDEDDGDH
jgi:hypothetical protein